MTHTTATPDSDGHSDAKVSPLANPRRIRLGADGRPITVPVTTTSN